MTLLDCLAQKEGVTTVLSIGRLEALCDPGNYLGACGQMVDDVLALRQR